MGEKKNTFDLENRIIIKQHELVNAVSFTILHGLLDSSSTLPQFPLPSCGNA